MAEEFLHGDQGNARLDEQGRAGVSQIMKADAADASAVAEHADAAAKPLGVEWRAGPGGEDLAGFGPGVCGAVAVSALVARVGVQGVDAGGGEGDAPVGGVGLGGHLDKPSSREAVAAENSVHAGQPRMKQTHGLWLIAAA